MKNTRSIPRLTLKAETLRYLHDLRHLAPGELDLVRGGLPRGPASVSACADVCPETD